MRKILFVDDYDDIRYVACAMISIEGYEVLGASNGNEAIEMTLAHRPDLVLMDIAMPEADGLQAARAIRSHPELADIPLVAVTSFIDFYRDKAIEAGFIDVIEKGRFLQEIRSIIRTYMPADLSARTSAS
jgi:two-component system cell cycle response regulator DivK